MAVQLLVALLLLCAEHRIKLRGERKSTTNKSPKIRSSHKSFHVTYNAESSGYFSWQVRASFNSYRHTMGPLPHTNYTRLLTMPTLEKDDIAEYVPTFVVKRDMPLQMSRQYAPVNKPHAVARWLESPNGPTEDVIALVDPDCFFVGDLTKWTDQVEEGSAVAQAAYYVYNQESLQTIYDKHYCKKNCGFHVDPVGVPYIVHRKDLAKIAPLWRDLVVKMFEDMQPGGKAPAEVRDKLKSMGGAWCVEMFAYNVAAAEIGVKHKMVYDIQRRDVDGMVWPPDKLKEPIIHIGRAWFPKSYKDGKKWWLIGAPDFKEWSNDMYGQQVWVKGNWTSGYAIPWPLPKGINEVSRYTLEALKAANDELPPLKKSKYRGEGSMMYYGQFGFI